ncbi:MAG: hypothetical protein AB9866_15695 [Syntrophobacteraceae bacterium]
MEDKDPLDIILEAVADAKAKAIDSISTDELISFVQEIKNRGFIPPAAMKRWEAELQAWSGKEAARYTEMIKAVVLTGQAALKSAILINGGATVAVLSLIGSLLIKAPEGKLILVHDLAASAFAFAVGVLLSAIASGTTYLSTFCISELGGKTWQMTAAMIINGTTWALVIASYAAFLWGAIHMYSLFRIG